MSLLLPAIGPRHVEGAVTPPSIIFQDSAYSSGNQTNYTFSAQPIKDVADVRALIIGVTWENSATAREVSTLTVDGVSASRIHRIPDSTSAKGCEIWLVELTGSNGATGDIVVGMSGSNGNCSISFAVIEDLASTTPKATSDDISASGAELNPDINTFDDSVLFAVGMNTDHTNTHTWVGATEQADANNDNHKHLAATATIATGETPRTVTVTASTAWGTAARSCVVCMQ